MPTLAAPAVTGTTLTKQKRNLLLAVLLAAIIAAPLTIALVGDKGSLTRSIEQASRAFGPARDVLALLSERSPGDRTTAELTKGKGRVASARRDNARWGRIRRPILPPSVVESLSNEPPLAAVVVPNPVPVIEPVPTLEALAAQTNIPQLAGIAPIIGGPGIGGPGGSGGPGGGGLPETPPGIVNPPVTPPVTSAVPEPQTWLTMLLGFALIGGGIRRERRSVRTLRRA